LQVEEAVRARLSLEKEASLLRASNDNYAQQVDALTAQVSKLEVSIAEATEQNNLATTQLQQVK
jgi:phage shock protein A